jgi:hypothetical protein
MQKNTACINVELFADNRTSIIFYTKQI